MLLHDAPSKDIYFARIKLVTAGKHISRVRPLSAHCTSARIAVLPRESCAGREVDEDISGPFELLELDFHEYHGCASKHASNMIDDVIPSKRAPGGALSRV